MAISYPSYYGQLSSLGQSGGFSPAETIRSFTKERREDEQYQRELADLLATKKQKADLISAYQTGGEEGYLKELGKISPMEAEKGLKEFGLRRDIADIFKAPERLQEVYQPEISELETQIKGIRGQAPIGQEPEEIAPLSERIEELKGGISSAEKKTPELVARKVVEMQPEKIFDYSKSPFVSGGKGYARTRDVSIEKDPQTGEDVAYVLTVNRQTGEPEYLLNPDTGERIIDAGWLKEKERRKLQTELAEQRMETAESKESRKEYKELEKEQRAEQRDIKKEERAIERERQKPISGESAKTIAIADAIDVDIDEFINKMSADNFAKNVIKAKLSGTDLNRLSGDITDNLAKLRSGAAQGRLEEKLYNKLVVSFADILQGKEPMINSLNRIRRQAKEIKSALLRQPAKNEQSVKPSVEEFD